MLDRVMEHRLKPWEIYGGKRPFFVEYAEEIGEFIKAHKLSALDHEILSPAMRLSKIQKSDVSPQMMPFVDPGSAGGKRFAHFHYRGEIYKLDQRQWQEFTSKVKTDLVNRLQMANVISIEQIQDLSDAIDAIG